MNTAKKIGAWCMSLFIAVMPLLGITPAVVLADSNLLTNGSLDATTTGDAPTGWHAAGYDDNGNFATRVAFTYIAGRTGLPEDKAVQVSVTDVISGDAKWIPDASVTVIPGALYTFSDWYQSDATSYLVAAYTYPDNTTHYVPLATLNPSAGWTQASADFSIPSTADPISVTFFHMIKGIGTLATDDYSLTAGAAGDNSFTVPMVSLTFDDGWTSQYDNARPKLLAAHMPATFFVISTTTIAASADLIAEQASEQGGVSATPAAGGTGTIWTPIYTDPTNALYRFTDTYQGGASTISVTYTPAGGSETTVVLGTFLEALGSSKAAVIFTLPALQPSTPISISHTSATSLTAANGALMRYGSGYMNTMQLKDLRDDGFEVGAHSENHCSLTGLLLGNTATCPFMPAIGATAQSEITNSKTILEGILGNTLSTFAYPYGDYNAEVKGDVTNAGLVAARSIDAGYNRPTTDKLALKTQVVDASTTFPMVKNWIDTARDNKLWLILTFHQVDNPADLASNGENGGTTPEMLQSIIDYLQSQSTSIVSTTVKGALDLIASSGGGTPATDTTAPVITLNGDATINLTVGDLYIEQGATAHDNVDGDLTSSIVTSGVVNTAETETSTVTYTVHDAAGNSASATRTIVVHAIVHTPETPSGSSAPADTSSGSGGGGNGPITGAFGSFLNFNFGPDGGAVLGVSTSTVPTSCADVLKNNLAYMSKSNNKSDVQALQTFLNTHEGEKLPVSGLYGAMTRAAVSRFQTKHASEVLTPVGLKKPTGNVGPMTRKLINQLSCTASL